ncbi:MAG: response regulator [Pedobacter sp.]|nr:response regulator [Pedobacter sp.]MDQ8051605.1 response regulator [Pedobacter sp.]
MEKCIYVVEDNAQLREIIEFLLVEESYQVKAYPNVASFWKEMHRHIPDLIVLDVMLPDGNGMDICAKLKRDAKTHDIPVMMMSANNYLRTIKSKCPAEDFINKPFDINDFVNRVEQYVGAHSA